MEAMAESQRGNLLISAPSLFDWFRRTVVLVIEHTEEGALGVVLNRPTSARVADAVPALGALAADDELVRVGGPVAAETVLGVGVFDDPTAAAATPVVGTLGVLDPERAPEGLRRLRVYAGHAGWGPGQLEGELEQGAWIVEPAAPDDPFRDDDLWAVALRRKGGRFRLIATMPADPSVN
jgi:putative transcriptional regulator